MRTAVLAEEQVAQEETKLSKKLETQKLRFLFFLFSCWSKFTQLWKSDLKCFNSKVRSDFLMRTPIKMLPCEPLYCTKCFLNVTKIW